MEIILVLIFLQGWRLLNLWKSVRLKNIYIHTFCITCIFYMPTLYSEIAQYYGCIQQVWRLHYRALPACLSTMCGLVKDMFLFIIAYSTIAYVNDTETYTERLDALMTCRLPEHDNAAFKLVGINYKSSDNSRINKHMDYSTRYYRVLHVNLYTCIPRVHFHVNSILHFPSNIHE